MNKLIATLFLAVLATGSISGCVSEGNYDARIAAEDRMHGVPYGEDWKARMEREDRRDDAVRIQTRR